MKRCFAFILIFVLIPSLYACGSKSDGSTDLTNKAADIIESENPDSVISDSENKIENKIENGDFSKGISGWEMYCEDGKATFDINKDGQGAIIEITSVGTVDYGVQINYKGISLSKGSSYQLKFDVSSTLPRQGSVRMQLNSTPYSAYFEDTFDMDTEMKTYTFNFPMNDTNDPAAALALNIGQPADLEEALPGHTVIFDNFSLVLISGQESGNSDIWGYEVPSIHVDQSGYFTNDIKKAILVSDDELFQVCDASNGNEVYYGTAKDSVYSPSGDENIRIADFSEFTKPGKYIIKNGDEVSFPFEISLNPYAGLREAILNVIEAQSCGKEVDFDKWSHPACHTELATIYGTGKTLDVFGGWHDAGDYGRYVVPAAQTVADLLLADELSGKSDPALLEIVKWELEWMLKMQDQETGGVYHKVTAKNFCDMDMFPQNDTAPLIISPVSSTATGDFAAVMAMASRSYHDVDSAFADKMLDAAKKAWAWLVKNPGMIGAINEDDIVTGEYGDSSSEDERYWAACELYVTTGENIYHDYIKKSEIYSGLGWADAGTFGSISYLFGAEGMGIDDDVAVVMKKNLFKERDRLLNVYNDEPYMVSMKEYSWGSNMIVSNNMIIFMVCNLLEKNEMNSEIAMEHLHYLLGRNPLSQGYVTGFGTISPQNPHHRPSVAAQAAIPGMLSGGPDQNLEDAFAKSVLNGCAPAKCYVDNVQSYSTNEITIYWNSAFYLALTLLNIE